jgi:hypothetical protein
MAVEDGGGKRSADGPYDAAHLALPRRLLPVDGNRAKNDGKQNSTEETLGEKGVIRIL